MKKVYVNVTIKLILNADEDANVTEALDDLDYCFNLNTDKINIEDSSIEDYEITDSK